MIGNSADAAIAYADFRAGIRANLLSAQGCTRMVYLINDVVYKCELEPGANADEFSTIKNLANALPRGFYFPEVSLFDVNDIPVLAMEYIDGIPMAECFCIEPEVCDATCAPPFVVDTLNRLDMDPGGFNVMDYDGAYYIIDAL